MSAHPAHPAQLDQYALPLAVVPVCLWWECGRPLDAQRSTKKFCDETCRLKHHRAKKRASCNGSQLSVAGSGAPLGNQVRGDNSDLMRRALLLGNIRDGDVCADVTYGKGVFWRQIDRRRIILRASDIAPKPYVAHRKNIEIRELDFRSLPYDEGSIDALVLDPPYCRGSHPINTFQDRYGSTTALASLDEILELYRAGMTEACRVLRRRGGRLFVKGMDQVENGRQRWFSIEVPLIAYQLGMFLHERLTLLSPKTSVWYPRQRQIHARHEKSFLWIFERERACSPRCSPSPSRRRKPALAGARHVPATHLSTAP